MKRTRVLSEEGKPLMVLRPKDPLQREVALASARALVGKEGAEAAQAFQDILQGEYQFLGYLAKDVRTGRPSIVDDKDAYVGELEPGDSFATYEPEKAPC